MKIRSSLAALALLGLASAIVPHATAQEPSAPEVAWDDMTAEEQQAIVDAWKVEFLAGLTERHGAISLEGGAIMLDVPDDFYFLDKADGRKVLEEAWGNPPDEGISGMLFRTGITPLDEDNWGVIVYYEDSGYVSDEEASTIDYDALLTDLKRSTEDSNSMRKQMGYPGIELVGWATHPEYRAETHKMFWAKELAFEDEDANTLNYDIRVLGRKGVLTLQYVAGIDLLPTIEASREDVLAIPDFTPGNRYEDFDPKTDKVASYGLTGLIAGGAGLAIAKKTGLIAIALAFAKKGWILLLAGFGAISRFFMGRKKED